MSVSKHHNPRQHRHNRVRARVSGTSVRPRLVVFRSLKHIYAQIIDDTIGQTLIAASDREITTQSAKPTDLKQHKMIQAYQVGALIADKAVEKKITTIVYDRGGYRYHGRVKALAEGARAGKLQF